MTTKLPHMLCEANSLELLLKAMKYRTLFAQFFNWPGNHLKNTIGKRKARCACKATTGHLRLGILLVGISHSSALFSFAATTDYRPPIGASSLREGANGAS